MVQGGCTEQESHIRPQEGPSVLTRLSHSGSSLPPTVPRMWGTLRYFPKPEQGQGMWGDQEEPRFSDSYPILEGIYG